jgi:hypothetical protein
MAGVDSIAAQGEAQLTGHVTVSEGSGITLAQVGQDIEIGLTPFDPTAIATLQAWYDCSDVPTLTITSNKVSQWDDKTANNFDLTQATAGTRPLYNATPRFMNGVTVPEFAAAQYMESSCPADDRTSTTFFAGYLDSVAASRCPFSDTQGGGNELRVAVTTGGLQTLKSATALLFANGQVGIGPVIVGQRLTATTLEHTTVGAVFIGADATTFTAARTLRLGASTEAPGQNLWWDGLLAEFLRYDATLTDINMYAVLNYLAEKWLPR